MLQMRTIEKDMVCEFEETIASRERRYYPLSQEQYRHKLKQTQASGHPNCSFWNHPDCNRDYKLMYVLFCEGS